MDERAKAKPTLILMSIHLMNQWIRAFDFIASSQFITYKYHGDTRVSRHVPIASEHGLDTLSKKYALFHGNEQNAYAVVLSTLHIWNERYNPKTQIKYQKNLAIEADRIELDPQWAGGFPNCFRVVVIDATQLIKIVTAECSLLMLWLAAKFHVLSQASPHQMALDTR